MVKESLQAQIPVPVATLLRQKAADDRRSLSATTTEMLCRAFKIDPAQFGIEPRTAKTATAKVG